MAMDPNVIQKLGFDIVHGCQLRCIGCPNSTLKPEIKFISVEDFNTCLSNIDVRLVGLIRLFNFGEPLLHPELPEILMQIPNQPWKYNTVELSTNAQKLDEDMLVEIFKNKVMTHLVVSCDGNGTKEDYERLRPPAKWEKLIEFLTKASEIRNKYNTAVDLWVRSVCTSRKGQRRWNEIFNPLGWRPFYRDWAIMPDSIENPSGRTPKIPSGVCVMMKAQGDNNFYIDHDGVVVPCCCYPRVCDLGNLKTQKYTEIYDGVKKKSFIKELAENRKNMKICGRCEVS